MHIINTAEFSFLLTIYYLKKITKKIDKWGKGAIHSFYTKAISNKNNEAFL